MASKQAGTLDVIAPGDSQRNSPISGLEKVPIYFPRGILVIMHSPFFWLLNE